MKKADQVVQQLSDTGRNISMILCVTNELDVEVFAAVLLGPEVPAAAITPQALFVRELAGHTVPFFATREHAVDALLVVAPEVAPAYE